jgi:TatA/E family protein of Tat protein translocase
MHFGDSIFIFLLALVLFGPKKLPEIGRTVGKLLAEFRRASNEFKFQIQEELRNMEEDERRKKLAEAEAQKTAAIPATTEAPAPTEGLSILPPSTGTPVSTSAPYATPAGGAEATPIAETVEPSAGEVAVDPPLPTPNAAPQLEAATEPSAHVDLTTHTNGIHSSIDAEPASSSLTSETLHHG